MAYRNIRPRLILASALLCVLVNLNPLLAQRRVSTVTMKTGVRYEGDVYQATSVSTLKEFDKVNIVRIDDGLREIFVGLRRVGTSGESDRNELEVPIFQRDHKGQELASDIVYVGPFNEKGHREFVVAGVGAPWAYTQAITKLNPRYCEVKLLAVSDNPKTIQWTMRIGTDTVPTSVLRSLLRREISDPKNPTEYIRVADFFIQANRLDAAQEEIKFIKSKFPDLEERMNDALKEIRQAYARVLLREINLRFDSGQPVTAMSLARAVDKADLAVTVLAEFADIEEKFETQLKKLDTTREKINQCINQVAELDAHQTEAVRRLKAELETELNIQNVPRLDAFLRLADDPTTPAQQKLALIISGWLLGSNQAIENLAVAQELFSVRDLVRNYLQTRQPAERDQVIEQLKKFESGNPQQLTAMIQQMKPALAPDLSQYNGSEPMEFEVEIPRPAVAQDLPPLKFRCLVHLPTEYDPYRKYPLLVSLPPIPQTVEQNLNMWCGIFSPSLNQRVGHAERNGYIVMSVDWRLPGQMAYQYSAMEHKTVLGALRQALRMFSVDSDRVFLAGHADGGDAALDIGLSHPEHWAGIVGISAGIKKYARQYAQNEHWGLPVYCVAGKRDNASMETNHDLWTEWVANVRYVDATVVWYHGRGAEMFDREEMPETFKWMNAQRRKWPDRSEFSIKCKILRPWDNYFWFIELDKASFPTDKMVFPEAWPEKIGAMGSGVEAFYKTVNRFRVNRSTKALNFWLGPDFADFSQEISISGQIREFKGKVEPSVRTLLEDIRLRADREHPYWAKLELSNQQWIAR
jgi:predicted esterase